jgi:PST family polysaccharide transporter
MVDYLWKNSDNILIAKFFDEGILGLYSRAHSLMRYPIRYLNYVFQPVLHPVLSKVQDDRERIRSFYLKFLKLMSLVALPFTVVMFMLARDIVLILYGNQWVESIELFRFLSIASGLMILKTTTAPVFQAVGRTDVLFRLGILEGATTLLGIVIGLFFSIRVVAIGYMTATIVTFVPIFMALLKLVGGSFRDFWSAVRQPLLIALMMLAVLMVLPMLLTIEPLVFHFAVYVCVSAVVYAVMIFALRLDRFILKSMRK